jgi:predicted  nucleic acid-binding Zn-ribbon protein
MGTSEVLGVQSSFDIVSPCLQVNRDGSYQDYVSVSKYNQLLNAYNQLCLNLKQDLSSRDDSISSLKVACDDLRKRRNKLEEASKASDSCYHELSVQYKELSYAYEALKLELGCDSAYTSLELAYQKLKSEYESLQASHYELSNELYEHHKNLISSVHAPDDLLKSFFSQYSELHTLISSALVSIQYAHRLSTDIKKVSSLQGQSS